ncbi:adenosylcobinamide-GDP ribazoletransferase [Roseomonas marmotae]|uniref:Adenosylcobinamide-GDP ribazoletransferase n=1 Tax=Roseomonas marmotae TaxID=2768161 RepID=A0ABS3KCH2_9PROT|nr:adenosylcobinamide-GDP ribazoletransferase [Roseomonas marmotae]MBO1075147.1 adenosylcobinamide-GDP ribazoletransferase [Roseomonas marmotae]QTI79741.1 adenosylcobinamide-GDP ribazoletransferase [Roseomonas marmotae]
MRDLLADLSAALGLLTRLPTGWLPQHDSAAGFARGIWAYPLVGFGIGAAGGALLGLGHWLGLPPLVAALCALCATLLLTGGFHEDGLADTADGFGGGRDTAHKLEIMRDSRIGSYGVLALVVVLGLRASALASLPGGVLVLAAAGGAAAALGRGVILLLLRLLPPARPDGMAAGLGRPAAWPFILGLLLAVLPALLLLPPGAGFLAILAALACGLLLARLARRQIGGQTGDVLGAGAGLGECAALVVLSAALTG